MGLFFKPIFFFLTLKQICDNVVNMKNLKKLLLIGAFICLLIPCTSMAASPTASIYLRGWTQDYRPINETCTGYCNPAGHPQHQEWRSSYNVSNGTIRKSRNGIGVTAPLYHRTFLSWEYLNNDTGLYKMMSTDDNWVTSTQTNWPITSLDVGERFAHGDLSRSITNTLESFYNTISLSETSQAVLQFVNGDVGCLFTYNIYFKVQEQTLNTNGVLITVGTVPYNQVALMDDFFHVVQDGSEHGAGYCKVVFLVPGSNGTQVSDITPYCDKPFFVYSFATPVLVQSECGTTQE
jgi:hypothetical protein